MGNSYNCNCTKDDKYQSEVNEASGNYAKDKESCQSFNVLHWTVCNHKYIQTFLMS